MVDERDFQLLAHLLRTERARVATATSGFAVGPNLGSRAFGLPGRVPPRLHGGPRSTVTCLPIPFHSCPIFLEQLVIRTDLFPNVEGKLAVGPYLGCFLERPRIVRERSLNNPRRQK